MHAARPTAAARNVITDYSWLTNRRAGSRPINPARFSPMPRQGDSGGGWTASVCVRVRVRACVWGGGSGEMVETEGTLIKDED